MVALVIAPNSRPGILADVLQMLSSNLMSGIFTLNNNDVEIKLYLNDGEIFHADGADIKGESAFFAAMALEEGQFFLKDTDELPKERTLEGQTQFLVLEALRQIDESRSK